MFSLRPSVQIGSGVQPTSYPMGTGDSFPGKSGLSVKLTTHPTLGPLYLHSPIYLHGVVLS